MLIRSQNKRFITDISGMTIKLISKDKEFRVVAYGNNQPADAVENLGEYSSDEKAIKVLDAIQKEYGKYIYGPGGMDVISREMLQPMAFIPPKVFQMPQDSEVED